MRKVPMMKKVFAGVLRGNENKEKYFSALREKLNLELPRVNESSKQIISADILDGAFLSCLDGAGSLKVCGKKVSKIAVCDGEIEIPKNFSLTFIMERHSEASTQLRAEINPA